MTGDWNVERMLELGRRHAEIETAGDLEGTMATLIENPVYEFFPVGLRLEGGADVRRYYRHLMNDFIPNITAGLIEEWVSPNSLAQEYEVVVDPDGAAEAHRVIGVLFVAEGTELLGGERIWGSERCLRLMLGDELFDELQPVRP